MSNLIQGRRKRDGAWHCCTGFLYGKHIITVAILLLRCFSGHSNIPSVDHNLFVGVVCVWMDGVETSRSSSSDHKLKNTSHEKRRRMDPSDDEAFSVTEIAAAAASVGPMCQANPWPTVVPSQIYICNLLWNGPSL